MNNKKLWFLEEFEEEDCVDWTGKLQHPVKLARIRPSRVPSGSQKKKSR